jgi:hypothetical protein
MLPHFLNTPNVYDQTEAFWGEQLTQFLAPHGITHQPFYNKQMGNGQKIRDGNPIFDAYIPQRHKLLRIIQEPLDDEPAFIGGFTKYWPTPEMDPDKRPHPTDPNKRNEPIPELVLHLVLTETTLATAKQLWQHWLVEDKSVEEMDGVLDGMPEA